VKATRDQCNPVSGNFAYDIKEASQQVTKLIPLALVKFFAEEDI